MRTRSSVAQGDTGRRWRRTSPRSARRSLRNGVQRWYEATARELAPHGIRVHAVLPGGVNTDMVRDVRPDIDTSELISPEEVAEAVGLLIAMEGNAVIDELMIRRASKTPWSM